MSEQPNTENGHNREQMNIVIAGHVDHGKSTVIGRLLHDTGSLPSGKIEQIKKQCELNAKPFEYAFLLDALKDEQAQGITIDAARVFFKTEQREYIIIDAPGHIEFLKNMVTGASRAECALLVIDAKEGVRENSRRHGYMLSMLGIKQIAVLVNKMDLVDYQQDRFDSIENEYREFLAEIGVVPHVFIPLSGFFGDNVAAASENMSWYDGPTVLQVLDQFEKEAAPMHLPFRMPVQDVYKFTAEGDSRRIVAGTIDSGSFDAGDEVVFYPSGKHSKVVTVEAFNRDGRETRYYPYATGFTLDEQIYITRGEIAVKATEKRPEVTSRLRVSLFWLGKKSLSPDKEYFLKLGTTKVPVRLEEIERVIDASSLDASSSKNTIDRHDVAECILKTKKAIAFDTAEEIAATSRFVIVDDYEIAGGGIILAGLDDKQTRAREEAFERDFNWERGNIRRTEREERLSQKPSLILLTGAKDTGKKDLGKALEASLFHAGRQVYFLAMDNLLLGLDRDLENKQQERKEHIRRLAELTYLFLDAGLILILSASYLTQDEVEYIKTILCTENVQVFWTGEEVVTDVIFDKRLPANNVEDAVELVKATLQEKRIIYSPW